MCQDWASMLGSLISSNHLESGIWTLWRPLIRNLQDAFQCIASLIRAIQYLIFHPDFWRASSTNTSIMRHAGLLRNTMSVWWVLNLLAGAFTQHTYLATPYTVERLLTSSFQFPLRNHVTPVIIDYCSMSCDCYPNKKSKDSGQVQIL